MVRAQRARERRTHAQSDGRRLARSEDGRYMAGCMLFWAEGSRCRNSVQLTNSDPELMRFFVRFLRHYFAVPGEKMRVACHLFADHADRQREIEDFWLGVVDLPRALLAKTQLNTYSKWTKKKRTNKLPYGTCRVIVHDTRIVQMLYGSIQEIAGFSRSEWLEL